MKKIVSLVLAISMVLSMFVSAFAATSTFDDVKDTKYAGAVEALVELDVIGGFPDGTFKPEEEVTRAQLAKMLVICLGLSDTVEALEGKTVFSDVDESHWASGYINAAVQSKIIAGYPDGTFKPEKEVSYAEAVTMVIRALGYGNVVDSEGVWPTAYMLKAIELELLDDMGSPKSGEAALRGNVAILLWNMLRTPMWKIVEESEGNGMTSKADSLMLNVKFPDYYYFEDAYVYSIDVDDRDVKVTLVDKDGEGLQTAYVEDVDLPRVLEGMKVSALVKDYKDKEDATFLTLTKENTLVEGVVTKVSSTRIEIDDVEYRVNDAKNFAVNDYVVLEVDGKKATTYKKDDVFAILTKEATEVEKISKMESQIDEDALVIIDGEWASREDIELGDVYTELRATVGTYYMVARERVEGTFESLTYKASSDKESYRVEVDGEEYVTFDSILKAYDGKENENELNKDESDLMAPAKNNNYIDNEVELVFNYLGQVVIMNFGDVVAKANDGDFYAVTSAGAWDDRTSEGAVWYVKLTGLDGEEDTYTFKRAQDVPDFIKEQRYGKNESGDALFVWAKFDGEKIKEIKEVTPGTYGSTDKYIVEEFVEEMNDDNYLNSGDEHGGHKVTASTIVLKVTPVIDSEDDVVGFDVESATGTDALEGVEKGLVIYDDTTTTKKAKFVLVSQDAKSNELHFGILENAKNIGGKVYAQMKNDSELYEMKDEDLKVSDVQSWAGMVAVFTIDDDKITIVKAISTADLVDAPVVEKLEDETVVFVDDSKLDPTKKSTIEYYEDYAIALVEAKADKNDNYIVSFVDVEDLGKGIENAKFSKGYRMIENNEDKKQYVVLVSGFDYDDVLVEDNDGECYLDVNADANTDAPVDPTTVTVSGDVVVVFEENALLDKSKAYAAVKAEDEFADLPELDSATSKVTFASEVELPDTLTATIATGDYAGQKLTVTVTTSTITIKIVA